MNKPKITKIGYTNYKIKYVRELKDKENEDLYGKIDLENKEIHICDQFDSQIQKATIVHESIHGIESFIGLDLTENEVIGFSNMLFLWMLENKNTIRYLIEEDN